LRERRSQPFASLKARPIWKHYHFSLTNMPIFAMNLLHG